MPPNRKLLSHPDLKPYNKAQKQPQSKLTESTPGTLEPTNLNLGSALSATTVFLDYLIQHRMQTGGIQQRQDHMTEGTNAMASLAEAKRVTSGVLVGNGIHSLNNPSVLARVYQKEKERSDKVSDNTKKKWRELLTQISKVHTIRNEKGRGEETGFQSWNDRQCRDYLQYKKVDTGGAKGSWATASEMPGSDGASVSNSISTSVQ